MSISAAASLLSSMSSCEIEEVHPFTAMKSAECYEILEELVQSEKGVNLYRAKYIKSDPKDVSGNIVVIKVFKHQRLLVDNDVWLIMSDVEHSRYSEHKNVAKVYCSFVDNGDLWVVMNSRHYARLDCVVSKNFQRGLPEKLLGIVLRESLEGLYYLHGRGWMHRNFDLGHVFLDKDDAIRIDFDFLAYDPDGKIEDSEALVCLAPREMTDGGLELKSDIWCFGIAALKLALGNIPAKTHDDLDALLAGWTKKLKKQGSWMRGLRCVFGGYLPDEEEMEPRKISPAFLKMVIECLTSEPSKRPTTKQLLECDYFLEFRDEKPLSFIELLLG